MSLIPADEYKKIIETMPILCVDLIVQNSKGEYLLVKRTNEPLKGQWWVIGGRVPKEETMEQAARRKIKQETGLDIGLLKPIGYYEDKFEANPFGLVTTLHTVSVVFLTVVDHNQQIKLDHQSANWKFSKELPEDFLIRRFTAFSQ
jgi:colanic acid biosynthesis protein WcaH